MLDSGEVKSISELARLGRVPRARITTRSGQWRGRILRRPAL